jgi:DNA helicase-2/ATP-dependent DNA helicase PcrA
MDPIGTAAVTPEPAIERTVAAARIRTDAFDELFA